MLQNIGIYLQSPVFRNENKNHLRGGFSNEAALFYSVELKDTREVRLRGM